MEPLKQLLEQNRRRAESVKQDKPEFFEQLSEGQSPDFMWIGCADSRVPPNDITGCAPGELFVHRNVANLVVPSDLNCISAVHFAVEVLKVRHIIICGHHRCGGVEAVVGARPMEVVDKWLRPLTALYERHRHWLDEIEDIHQRENLLSTLNVLEQVRKICSTPAVRDAWTRGREPAVHGLVYRLKEGLLSDLGVSVMSTEQVEGTIQAAIDRLTETGPERT